MRPAKIAVAASFSLLLVASGAVAFAADLPGKLTIRPGPLSLDSSAQKLTVTDATGSGDGWHVLASVTGGSGRISSAQAPICGTGSTCSLPRSNIAYPVTITGSPVTIAEALPGTGMGTIVTGLSWRTTSDITLQIISGP